jgi:hypothetical protein
VTPSAAPLGACTTTPRGTRPASRSWRAGPTSGSASWAGSTTRGQRRSTPVGSCRRPIRCRRPSGRLGRWSSGLGGDAAPTAVTAIPLLVFDAGYDPIALTCGLAEAGVRVAVLVRIRSCAAPSSGSRSAGCPSPPAGSWSCGCGGQARERRIWTWSGGRTCAASTSSTRCGFVSRRWAGSPPGCAIPSRPTGGPGCCWPLPPNSAWPGHWSPTNACRGNGGLIRIGSPPPVSDGGFAGFTRPYRRSPGRRNPAGQARGGPKAPVAAQLPAILPSERTANRSSQTNQQVKRKLTGCASRWSWAAVQR